MTASLPPQPDGPTGPSGWPDDPAASPRCYRHPDRETYIRCQRCNRPICPDCQIPAAVGFQCPECVREGNKSVRTTRTALGGVVTGGDGAIVTKSLIGLCVAVYVLQTLSDGEIVARFAMTGVNFSQRLGGVVGVADGEYYRLLTSAFLHASVTHLGVNMLSLWLLGPTLERLLGWPRFLTLYLVGALGGSAASYLINAADTVAVGASGAIFALFGALLPISRKLHYSLAPYAAMLALNAVIGFWPGSSIDWKAHLGGLITGIVLGTAVAYATRKRRDVVQLATVIGMGVVIVGIVIFRTQQLRHG